MSNDRRDVTWCDEHEERRPCVACHASLEGLPALAPRASKDEEFRHALEVLKTAMPELARALNSKRPRAPVPLDVKQFRALVRVIWDHGYEYGEAAQMQREDQRKGLEG